MSATIAAVVSRFVHDTPFEFDAEITRPLEKGILESWRNSEWLLERFVSFVAFQLECLSPCNVVNGRLCAWNEVTTVNDAYEW